MASRIESILTAILNDGTYTDEPQSRIEAILLAILNQTAYTAEAQSRIEAILLCILNGTDLGIVPQSRVETILKCIYHGEAYTGDTQSRIEELLKQISEKEPTPPTPTTFTATFIRADGDGGGTLYVQTDIPAGTVPVYGGETPTTTKGSAADYPFKGWTPALAPITEDTVYTAVFGGVEVKEITDSWDQIIASIDDGSYADKYSIGNYKPLDLGAQGVINMQIVAMDADELADGSGYAPLTFVGMELLKKSTYGVEYGTNSAYDVSLIKNYIDTTVYQLIPTTVSSRIQSVKKTYTKFDSSSLQSTENINVKAFAVSLRELGMESRRTESSGVIYGGIYKDSTARIKHIIASRNAEYWTRTAYDKSKLCVITTGGAITSVGQSQIKYVCFGFCLGRLEG